MKSPTKHIAKSILSIGLISLLAFGFYGCSDDSSIQNTAQSIEQPAKNSKLDDSVEIEKQPDYKEISITEFFDTPIEDINNESSYDMPRIQFLFSPQKSQWDQLWSVKIDGTDLREVIPYNDFYAPERDATLIRGVPIRSPNNQYVVMMRERMSKGAKLAVMYDIKTREWTEISPRSGETFSWLPDSSGFCLKHADNFYTYDIASKKLTPIDKRICGLGANKRPDGTYLTKSYDGNFGNSLDFSILDSNFKEVDSFNLQTTEKFTTINFKALDINGDVMLYQKRHNNRRKFPPRYFLYDINKKEVIKEIGEIFGEILYLSTKRGYLYSFSSPTLLKYSLTNPTKEHTMFDIRRAINSKYVGWESLYNIGELINE